MLLPNRVGLANRNDLEEAIQWCVDNIDPPLNELWWTYENGYLEPFWRARGGSPRCVYFLFKYEKDAAQFKLAFG